MVLSFVLFFTEPHHFFCLICPQLLSSISSFGLFLHRPLTPDSHGTVLCVLCNLDAFAVSSAWRAFLRYLSVQLASWFTSDPDLTSPSQ